METFFYVGILMRKRHLERYIAFSRGTLAFSEGSDGDSEVISFLKSAQQGATAAA